MFMKKRVKEEISSSKSKNTKENNSYSEKKNEEENYQSEPSSGGDVVKSQESMENISKQNATDNEDCDVEEEEEHPGFSSEVVNIEEDTPGRNSIEKEESNDEHSSNEYKNKKKIKYDSQGMDRISEVENEDEKHNTVFDKFNSEIMKDDYRINEENFDEIMRQNINSKNVKDLFNTAMYNTENEKYKFRPEINERSNMLAKEKRDKSSDTIRRDTPIELQLYQDAMKRKEKLQKIEYNNMMAIILNSSKTKISNNSHRIAINKIEKIIDSSVDNFQKEKKLSFINIGEILTDLKIFREIFPDKRDNDSHNRVQSYRDIKLELKSVREIQKRKKAEVDFYEQLWISLNPENKEIIKSDVFSEFLKILFSPVASSVKEISSILKQFLLAAFFLNSNPDEPKLFISPITERNLAEEEIWPLDKLVKEFLELKENILAYQNIRNPSKKVQEELQEKSKVSKYKSRSNFWEERLQALIDREKLRKQVLEEMKKENDDNVLKNCTFRPQISKKSTHIVQENLAETGGHRQPVFDKLYQTHKSKQIKRQKDLEDNKLSQNNKELEGCTFQPKFVSQKTFEKSMLSQEKPKGFTETVDRMRRGIIETMKKKYLAKKIPLGENYEKVKRANIQPFNITDLKKKEIHKDEEREDSEDYFCIQVTIPNGKERTLRVHKDDDPYEIAENFCLVYGMKEEIKQRLAKTILQFMNLYLIKSSEKSQLNDQVEISHHPQNNYSQNNLNLDDI